MSIRTSLERGWNLKRFLVLFQQPEDACACRITNRTLILPEFLAWCDNDHNAAVLETCTMIGSDLQLPFKCPADFYINMQKLANSSLAVRESSFLSQVSESCPITSNSATMEGC